MLDVLTKREFFADLDAGFGDEGTFRIKDAQDAWLTRIGSELEGARVLEIGGGNSRVLPRLAARGNACVNLDRFEGLAGGPTLARPLEGVEIVPGYIGEFERALEDASFDLVFSIAVLEHLAPDRLPDVFRDVHRLLKPGGRTYHARALFLGHEPSERVASELEPLVAAVEASGLRFLEEPAVGGDAVFRTEHATEADLNLWQGWRASPVLEELVLANQVVCLRVGCYRPE